MPGLDIKQIKPEDLLASGAGKIMRIGVIAAQGAFIEHIVSLRRLGVEASPIRLPGELEGLDGLIIPVARAPLFAS